VGLAQLMMQAGMFVTATTFSSEIADGIFTHYKREEDPGMTKGKLDEELSRMSEIADAIAPGALILLNESFAATNEPEGSEIARQVVSALVEQGVRVVFVTHLYDFARSIRERKGDDTTFLRAERRPDGTRPFRLTVGDPLETSFGVDVYRAVFGESGRLTDA
jgi:DNA mismatch repair ATPase MutS